MIENYKDKHTYISPKGRQSDVHLMDCMELMKQIPDKYFDLAVVDPEFGIGISKSARLVTDKGNKAKTWDDLPINAMYFKSLFRVSHNQIIWGGNYYDLGQTKHCVIWDKLQPENLSFGMFDYAWTSFSGSNKIFRQSVKIELNRIHPTQKPVALYDWIYAKYLPNGGKVLDTHLGSQSNRIAADKAGNIDFISSELDEDYFRDGNKRFQNYAAQLTLF